MAKATKVTVFDGQVYKVGDEIPDLGSIKCINADGNMRDYEGLLSDKDKLPTYVGTGSTALLYDGTDTKVFDFNETTGKWYEL